MKESKCAINRILHAVQLVDWAAIVLNLLGTQTGPSAIFSKAWTNWDLYFGTNMTATNRSVPAPLTRRKMPSPSAAARRKVKVHLLKTCRGAMSMISLGNLYLAKAAGELMASLAKPTKARHGRKFMLAAKHDVVLTQCVLLEMCWRSVSACADCLN